jgi:hypothetical protein
MLRGWEVGAPLQGKRLRGKRGEGDLSCGLSPAAPYPYYRSNSCFAAMSGSIPKCATAAAAGHAKRSGGEPPKPHSNRIWSGRQESAFSTKLPKYIKNMKTKSGSYLPGYQHRIWLEMDPCLPIQSIFSTAQPYHQGRRPCNFARQLEALRARKCASGHPAMSEARVPAGQRQTRRTLRSAQRGTECVKQISRSTQRS